MTEAISMDIKRLGMGDTIVTEYGELEVYEASWVCEPGIQLTVDAIGRVDGNHGKMVIRYAVQSARMVDNFQGFLFPATGKLVAVERRGFNPRILWEADLGTTAMIRPRDPTLCTSECMCTM